jgi:hypothetical protein
MLHKSLLASLSLVLVLVAASAGARECKPLYRAMGPPAQPAQYHAERMAIHTWEKHVLDLYGPDFAHWEKVQAQKIDCEKSGLYFICWIEGEPCR